jgi:glyoxylase I family protein
VALPRRPPATLARWYAEHLGIDNQLEGGDTLWRQERGPTVFAPFPADTDYFGRAEQAWMLNFRVRDLDAMLAQLRAAGVRIDRQETEERAGWFAWLADPEGNRIELWKPHFAPRTRHTTFSIACSEPFLLGSP